MIENFFHSIGLAFTITGVVIYSLIATSICVLLLCIPVVGGCFILSFLEIELDIRLRHKWSHEAVLGFQISVVVLQTVIATAIPIFYLFGGHHVS